MRTRSALRSTGLRPRLLGARALRTPWSRCARHLLRWEEYAPPDAGRRFPPARTGPAVFRIRRLYSAVNRAASASPRPGRPARPRPRRRPLRSPAGLLCGRRRGHTLRRIRSHHRFRSVALTNRRWGNGLTGTAAQKPGPASPAERAKLPSPVPVRRRRLGTPVFRPASPAERAKLPSPVPVRRRRLGTPVFRPASPAERAKLPSPVPVRRRRLGTPVFRPASPAKRAKLPSPVPA